MQTIEVQNILLKSLTNFGVIPRSMIPETKLRFNGIYGGNVTGAYLG